MADLSPKQIYALKGKRKAVRRWVRSGERYEKNKVKVSLEYQYELGKFYRRNFD